jgi:hypothetical protein
MSFSVQTAIDINTQNVVISFTKKEGESEKAKGKSEKMAVKRISLGKHRYKYQKGRISVSAPTFEPS